MEVQWPCMQTKGMSTLHYCKDWAAIQVASVCQTYAAGVLLFSLSNAISLALCKSISI